VKTTPKKTSKKTPPPTPKKTPPPTPKKTSKKTPPPTPKKTPPPTPKKTSKKTHVQYIQYDDKVAMAEIEKDAVPSKKKKGIHCFKTNRLTDYILCDN